MNTELFLSLCVRLYFHIERLSQFMTLFMLQEIHSHTMLAWRSARRTETMTCTVGTVHNGPREAGGTMLVIIAT